MTQDNESWIVVATPKSRWHLAQLLLHIDFKVKTEAEMRALNRFRRALSLMGPTRAFLDCGGLGEPPGSKDRLTRNRFDMRPEHADFLKSALEQIDKNGAQMFEIGTLVDQIFDRRTTEPDAESVAVLDSVTEEEIWEVPLPPYLSNETNFVAFVKVVAQTSNTFAEFRRLLLSGLTTPAEREEAKRPTA